MIIVPGKKKNLSRRYYANVIDYLVLLIFATIYMYIAGEDDGSGAYRVTGFKAFVIPITWFVYFPVSEAIYGQTLAKKALHLHLIDLKGQTPTLIQTVIRRSLDPLEFAFLGVPALVTINYSEKNQRIGDMMAGTTVIRTDAVCRYCGTFLELSSREVIFDSFTCPKCKENN